MKKLAFKNLGFLFITVILLLSMDSCLFSAKNKLSFTMNMKDAAALGAADVTKGRFALSDMLYPYRAGGDDNSEEIKLELKKITKDGSFPVFNFEHANTSLFNIVNVLQDPYGASTDVYVILDHCTKVWAEDSNDDTELPFGQILALHEDGTYTDVIGYKLDENSAQWLVPNGWEGSIWSNIVFDKNGNLYYVYYKPSEKKDKPDQVNLYKYNPQTRKTLKITDVNQTQIDKAVMVSKVEYIISDDGQWAFVKMQTDDGELALCAIDLMDSNKTTQLFYSADDVEMTFAYDNLNKAVYYNLQNEECPLYKISMNDEKFNAEEKQLIMQNLDSRKIQFTDSGLWSYSQYVGFQQILDSDGSLVNNIFSEYETDTSDDEYQISLRYRFVNNYLFRTSYKDFVCFDTISKTSVDLFKNIPNYENFKVLSFGLSTDSIIFSGTDMDSGKNLNGIIDINNLSTKILNAEDAFSSLVIVDESKIE
ncbi:MAG: hypothetical protein MJ188_05755 [Treponema sp.]|nr:hypothetical protein [Treponema sp.]